MTIDMDSATFTLGALRYTPSLSISLGWFDGIQPADMGEYDFRIEAANLSMGLDLSRMDTCDVSSILTAETERRKIFGPAATAEQKSLLKRIVVRPAGVPVFTPAMLRRTRDAVAVAEEHWIEVVLVDEGGLPIADEYYSLEMPDGGMIDGYTNGKGGIYIAGLTRAGSAKIKFPAIDERRIFLK